MNAISQLVVGQQLLNRETDLLIMTSLATAPLRRTQVQRSIESDARLLKAAAEILAEEGYLACTLERVGERAGFSRGLASRKYGSKDGLIEAVIWRVSDEVHAQIDTAIEGIASPLDQLLVLLDRFVELVLRETSVRAYFVLLSAMIANRLEMHETFRQVQERFGTRLEAILLAAQAAGEASMNRSPRGTVSVLGSLLAGLAVEVAMGNAEAAHEARADLAAMMRAALSA